MQESTGKIDVDTSQNDRSHKELDKGLPPLAPSDKGLPPLVPHTTSDKGLLPLVPEGGPSDEGFYLWFVTFVTHCSRVSERMVEFGVTDTEGKGLQPLVFDPEEQVAVAESLFDTAKRHRFAFVVLNVLPDHVHAMIPAASEKVLNARVRILKVYSAQTINQRRGSPKGTHVWAQKFNREVIESDESLVRVYEYIIGNHQKHLERWGDRLIHTWDKGLLPLVRGHCVDPLDITDPYDK